MAYSRIKVWIPGETLTASDLNSEFTGCIANDNDLATDLASEVTNRNTAIAANLPSGCMMPYAGTTAPTNWLLCYGQTVSRTTYSTLFGVIGTTFGVGDGSTTFNLPDMRGRSFIGLDNLGGSAASRVAAATSLGDTGGAETVDLSHTHTGPSHTHTYNTVIAHTHTFTTYNDAQNGTGVMAGRTTPYGTGTTNSTGSASGTTAAAGTGDTGAAGSTTQAVMNPYLAGGWIIKY